MPNTKTTAQPALVPVILAGGSGTRLWPMSRKHYAKQYLALAGSKTMLQETLERVSSLDQGTPLIVCNEETRFLAAEQLREIGYEDARILLEPEGRNTAPAIALAALEATLGGNDPLLLVMPADHKIQDTEQFTTAVTVATELASSGGLVTFGITPRYAEPNYGYIKRGDPTATNNGFRIETFTEKPDQKTADRYFAETGYFWNSGIFLFRAKTYLNELKEYRPDILSACRKAFEGRKADLHFVRFDESAFSACPSESVDYAVMEQTKNAAVFPLDAGWTDVGSWASLWATSEKDENGNCELGDVVSINSYGNYVNASHRLVTTIGCEDIVIVETKDAVLVAPKKCVDQVKQIVEKLKLASRPEVDFHSEVHRPWGKFDSIGVGARYQVKRITVNPGAKLSVQMHFHRAEHWIVVKGTALVTKGDETIMLTENQSTYISLGQIHALENPGKIPLELIEVQSGSYLGEDDIVRTEDKYGRN